MKNKYEVISLVGEGAYGIVYKAKVKETNEYVAIKKFKETSDELIQKTMKRELKVLKLIHHENIVEFKEGFHRKGNLFLIFEFVDKNLLEVLQSSPTGLEPNLIRSLIYQLCKATCYLHEKTIIHRDIKPENLLIDKQNNLKLCDFGFARRISGREIMTDYVATRWYRAPELLINNGDYGPEVDFWAIGCIMGELADGNPLFPGENEVDQIHCIQKILGNLPRELVDKFKGNPLFKGFKLLDVREPVGIERRYLGILGNKAIEFMKALLELDPRKRPNYRNVMDFDYFKCFRDKNKDNNEKNSAKLSNKKVQEDKVDKKKKDKDKDKDKDKGKYTENTMKSEKYNVEFAMATNERSIEKDLKTFENNNNNLEINNEIDNNQEISCVTQQKNSAKNKRNNNKKEEIDSCLTNSKGKSYMKNGPIQDKKKQSSLTRNPIKNPTMDNSTLNKSNNKDRSKGDYTNYNKNLNSSSDLIKNNCISPQNFPNIKSNNNLTNNNNNNNSVLSPIKKEETSEPKNNMHYKKVPVNDNKPAKKNHIKYFEKYNENNNQSSAVDKNIDINDKIIEESSNYYDALNSETAKENNANNANKNQQNNSNNNNSNNSNSNTKTYRPKECNILPVTYKKIDPNEKQKNYATIAMTTNNLFSRKVKQKKAKEHKKKEFFSLEKNDNCLIINNANNNNYLCKNIIPIINNNKSVKNNKKGFDSGYKTFYSSKKDDKYNYKININFKKTNGNSNANLTSTNNNNTTLNNNSNHNDKKYKKIIEEVAEISEFNNNETNIDCPMRNNQRSNFININFNAPKKMNPNVSSLDFNKTSERVFMRQINQHQLKAMKVNSLNRNKKGSNSSLNILSQKIKKNSSQCSIPVVNNNNNVSSGKEQVSVGFISFYNLQLPTLNPHHNSKKFVKY